jgi:hypothetical protein
VLRLYVSALVTTLDVTDVHHPDVQQRKTDTFTGIIFRLSSMIRRRTDSRYETEA